jgi:hypothetical protein
MDADLSSAIEGILGSLDRVGFAGKTDLQIALFFA